MAEQIFQGCRFVFTVNNPEGQLDFSDARVRIACWQMELGAEGTPHFQGYVCTKQNCRWTAVKKIIGQEAHVEVARGTAEQCIDYCTKSETQIEGPWFYPDEATVRVSHQGTRTDLANAAAQIVAGAKDAEIAPTVFVRNYRGLQALRQAYFPAKDRDNVTVLCIWGPPGIGKTTAVMTGSRTRPFALTVTETGSLWGNGYDGQETVLIDDYTGQLPYHIFNRICDRWAFQLPTKGGFVPARWTHVIICTNVKPDQWYAKWGQNLDSADAVLRRVGFGKWAGHDDSHTYIEAETREQLEAKLGALDY